MKIIAFDEFRPGVTMETIQPYLKEEVANVWRLWKAGYLEWHYLPLQAPLPLEAVMDASVDVAQPYDRTSPPTAPPEEAPVRAPGAAAARR